MMNKWTILYSIAIILTTILVCSCDQRTDNNSDVLYKSMRIPVESLENEPLDSATLTYYDETIESNGVCFTKFSLIFDSPHANKWLNLEEKYWHHSSRGVLISSVDHKSLLNRPEISVDTLISFTPLTTEKFNSLKTTYSGPRWESIRLPKESSKVTSDQQSQILVKNTMQGKVSTCIFLIDHELGIKKIRVFKVDPNTLYL